MDNDQQLLRRYAADGSEAAFGEIVARHVDLVYSAAFRRTGGDAHLAQDVAQLVFTDLARKVRSLPEHVVLPGWLHQATRYAAAQLLRTERRRAAREQEAVTMNSILSEADADPTRRSPTDADWAQIRPLLDEALDELGDDDRDALVLRFFEQRSLAEVGQALGANEDAARKRVTRALEKLRADLVRRGITTTAATLSAAISVNAVQTAPVGLAATLSTTAIAGTTLTTVAATATKTIAMTTLQKTIIGATLAAAVGTGIYEARQASNARADADILRQQQAALTELVQQLRSENNQAAHRVSAMANSNKNSAISTELLRLRGEVARLRKEAEAVAADAKEAKDLQSRWLDVVSNTPPIRTYTSTSMTTAAWGQTILSGGWKTPSGKRAIVLTTLHRGDDVKQVTIMSKVLEYTEEAGEALGLAQYNIEGQIASRAHILNPDQAKALQSAAQQDERVKLVAAPGVTTLSGRQAQLQAVDVRQTASGEKYSTGPVVDFIPIISPDGESVHVLVSAQLNYLWSRASASQP